MAELTDRLHDLIAQRVDRLPLPGHGRTWQRWQALAAVAAEDVALVKLFEGHTDALAILAECGAPPVPGVTAWATWAAEPPSARLQLLEGPDGVVLSGRKAWCSGAGSVSHALVTAWDAAGRQCLAAVDLRQPSVTVTGDGWHAVGMGRVSSPDVLFADTPAVAVGDPGGYLQRPGFWHGGAGIAACWYGASVPLAELVAASVGRRDEPHAAAHLGALDVGLRRTRALLHEAATWIDAHPDGDAQSWAMVVRAAAEDTATEVLAHAGRALGAGPLCRDEATAQRFADLPVFVRQSHAERDLAELGRLVAGTGGSGPGWRL